MTPELALWRAWSPEPGVLGGLALLAGLYLGLARPLTGRAVLFGAGLLTLLLALVSPLDALSDTYLFSAHMLQHMLLVLVAPPLLLLGLPPRLARRGARLGARPGPAGWLARPLPGWALFNGGLWLWHLPALYEATLRSAPIHIAAHGYFMTTALLFWWPVVAPAAAGGWAARSAPRPTPPRERGGGAATTAGADARSLPPFPGGWRGSVPLSPAPHPLPPGTRHPTPAPLPTLLSLFTTMLASTVLGIVLTFAPPGLYPTYWQARDPLGIRPLLRDGWGLTPAVDQQLGGLLMWVPGGLILAAATLVILTRWLAEPEPVPSAESPGRMIP